MIEAVESAGVVNAVNYSMRHIDAYLKSIRLLNAFYRGLEGFSERLTLGNLSI